jgi:DNA uptake protein ComE-like DNA-binding protein
MRLDPVRSVLTVGVFVLACASWAPAQQVAKRTAKRAAKEATQSAARDKAEDAAKGAVKKAMAPDALDLNTATPEQFAKLGLDEATTQKIVAARPFTGLEDPKLKEAIPAETMTKLQSKVTVKAPGAAEPAPAPTTDAPAPRGDSAKPPQ